jgi:hypothetical protein
VKHPAGGYGETLLSSGEHASLLPYFEIKVVPGELLEGRVRGETEDARRLLDVFRKRLKSLSLPEQLLFNISVNLVADQSISADPDFWPRITLLPGDRLLLRGRDPEEIKRFIEIFTQLATSDYTVPSEWSKQGGEIKGGTPHFIQLKFDPQAVRRVAAKVAYGLFKVVTNRSLGTERETNMRQYILGLSALSNEPVSTGPMLLNTTTSDAPHIVVISPPHDLEAAIVSLYGFKFRVEFGPDGKLPVPLAMLCQIDGSGIRTATPDEAVEIIASLRGYDFAQPWKKAAADAIDTATLASDNSNPATPPSGRPRE